MTLPQERVDYILSRTARPWIEQAPAHPAEIPIGHAGGEKRLAILRRGEVRV